MTTLIPDLLAHVAAVRDGACDDNELLVLADHLAEAGDEERAELIRVQCEIARIPDLRRANAGEGGIEWIRSLDRDHPAYVEDRRLLDRFRAFRDRECDLLARNPAWLAVSDPPDGIPATITRGFLTVTLPHTLCWRECTKCRGDGWLPAGLGEEFRSDCPDCNATGTEPHPVLRAVLASPVGPWVRRVRVEGRKPETGRALAGNRTSKAVWYNANRPSPSTMVPESAELPEPIYNRIEAKEGAVGRWKVCHTAEAATDALSLVVPRWARGAK